MPERSVPQDEVTEALAYASRALYSAGFAKAGRTLSGGDINELGAEAFLPFERVRVNPKRGCVYINMEVLNGNAIETAAWLTVLATRFEDPPAQPKETIAELYADEREALIRCFDRGQQALDKLLELLGSRVEGADMVTVAKRTVRQLRRRLVADQLTLQIQVPGNPELVARYVAELEALDATFTGEDRSTIHTALRTLRAILPAPAKEGRPSDARPAASYGTAGWYSPLIRVPPLPTPQPKS